MAKILEIAQIGNPVLRKQAEELTPDEIKSDLVQKLIEDMLFTLSDAGGLGIAAPQVYTPKRIIIIASHPSERYPEAPMMEPTVMINPRITKKESATKVSWEGCLSIPGIRGKVERFVDINIEYLDRNAKAQSMELTEFPARIFQHELDHLDGIMFTDRMDSMQDLVTDKEYLRIISESTP